MARATMASLISELRARANLNADDATVNGVTYWTDDQIQAVCESNYRDFRRVPMPPLMTYINGASIYTDYPIPISPSQYLIERDGAGGGLALRTGQGETPPAYTIEWGRNMIVFTADTTGHTYYLDCRAYDLNNILADIYEKKASFISANVNWQSDNHRIEARAEYDGYKALAYEYRMKGGSNVSVIMRKRTDEAPY